ncbi:hypothetical protein RUM44_004184 [Polyplax serrata]|uniref:Protein MIX23 n=1 Tax=Polyplax serrata TaxID=468196 RepID=A0ABR1B241_POLSC
MAAIETPECLDFLQFQDILKKMRELDDKIIYTLNTNLPTESFRGQKDTSSTCKELYGHLQQNFDKREKAIQKCINYSKDRVQDLKKKKDLNNDDYNIIRALRKEQSKLKLLQTELGVEEVVKDKTSKILYERCRMHYVPPNFSV